MLPPHTFACLIVGNSEERRSGSLKNTLNLDTLRVTDTVSQHTKEHVIKLLAAKIKTLPCASNRNWDSSVATVSSPRV